MFLKEMFNMTYVSFAFLSAFFAALTSILAKMGMKNVNSNLATALRTVVVLIFSWAIAFVTTPVFDELATVPQKTLVFLVLSGLTTGASWLCYFHALKIGNVNVVVPIDKSSVVFTILLSSLIFPSEHLGIFKAVCTVLIALGTLLMIEKKASSSSKNKKSAVFYAFAGSIFAALTSILGKIGVSDISSDLGSSIRTVIVLIMAWLIVFINRDYKSLSKIDAKSSLFIVLSGIATGASWLCYYRALSQGPASVVAPIDKLSILFTILLSWLIFGEKLNRKSFLGLVLLVSGTLLLLIC